MNRKILRTYLDSPSAHLDEDYLKNQGIFAAVEDEDLIGMNGLLQGAVGYIKLVVEERDFERAKTALDELGAGRVTPDSPEPRPRYKNVRHADRSGSTSTHLTHF